MNNQEPFEEATEDSLVGVLVALALWVESTSVRISALERMMKQQGISDADIAQATLEANEEDSTFDHPESLESFAALTRFLQNRTKRT